jgi:hypothetical protein
MHFVCESLQRHRAKSKFNILYQIEKLKRSASMFNWIRYTVPSKHPRISLAFKLHIFDKQEMPMLNPMCMQHASRAIFILLFRFSLIFGK